MYRDAARNDWVTKESAQQPFPMLYIYICNISSYVSYNIGTFFFFFFGCVFGVFNDGSAWFLFSFFTVSSPIDFWSWVIQTFVFTVLFKVFNPTRQATPFPKGKWILCASDSLLSFQVIPYLISSFFFSFLPFGFLLINFVRFHASVSDEYCLSKKKLSDEHCGPLYKHVSIKHVVG